MTPLEFLMRVATWAVVIALAVMLVLFLGEHLPIIESDNMDMAPADPPASASR